MKTKACTVLVGIVLLAQNTFAGPGKIDLTSTPTPPPQPSAQNFLVGRTSSASLSSPPKKLKKPNWVRSLCDSIPKGEKNKDTQEKLEYFKGFCEMNKKKFERLYRENLDFVGTCNPEFFLNEIDASTICQEECLEALAQLPRKSFITVLALMKLTRYTKVQSDYNSPNLENLVISTFKRMAPDKQKHLVYAAAGTCIPEILDLSSETPGLFSQSPLTLNFGNREVTITKKDQKIAQKMFNIGQKSNHAWKSFLHVLGMMGFPATECQMEGYESQQTFRKLPMHARAFFMQLALLPPNDEKRNMISGRTVINPETGKKPAQLSDIKEEEISQMLHGLRLLKGSQTPDRQRMSSREFFKFALEVVQPQLIQYFGSPPRRIRFQQAKNRFEQSGPPQLPTRRKPTPLSSGHSESFMNALATFKILESQTS